jgi:hypothetical protein
VSKWKSQLDGGARTGGDTDKISRVCHRWCAKDWHCNELVACSYDKGGDRRCGGGVDGGALNEKGWGWGVGEDGVNSGPDSGIVCHTCDYDRGCGNGLESGCRDDLGRREGSSEGLGTSSGAVVDYERRLKWIFLNDIADHALGMLGFLYLCMGTMELTRPIFPSPTQATCSAIVNVIW